MNRILIILGMHRSGTSITTKWLNECGLEVGEALLGPQESNRSGHFEDLDFFNFHEKVFEQNNMSFGGFQQLEKAKLTEAQISEFKSLIDKKNTQFGQWGWKDPRTCLFIRQYLNLIHDAHLFIISRNYNQIIQSLIARETGHIKKDILAQAPYARLSFLSHEIKGGITRKRSLGKVYSEACIHYYNEILGALKVVDPNRRTAIRFESMITNSDKALNKLLDQGFELKAVPFNKVYDPGLKSSTSYCPYIPRSMRNQLRSLQRQIDSYCI
ncbi:MAG: hypothetical protein RIC15_06170 [Vicingaceae bacterium]